MVSYKGWRNKSCTSDFRAAFLMPIVVVRDAIRWLYIIAAWLASVQPDQGASTGEPRGDCGVSPRWGGGCMHNAQHDVGETIARLLLFQST